MPHEVPGVFNTLLHHCQGFSQDDIEQAADTVSRVLLGHTWFRREGAVASLSVAFLAQVFGPSATVSRSPTAAGLQGMHEYRALSLQFPPCVSAARLQRPAD